MDTIENWTTKLVILAGFITALAGLFKAIIEAGDSIPRGLLKYLANIAALLIPNILIAGIFFYISGLYPNRLSEPNFFWSMVSATAIGVSLYAYSWKRWFFPKLQALFLTAKQENSEGQQKSNHSTSKSPTKPEKQSRSKKTNN